MAPPGGTFLIALNGVNDGFVYGDDGYHALVSGDGTAPYTVSGVDPKVLVQPLAFQHRMWFVEKDSTLAWYLPCRAPTHRLMTRRQGNHPDHSQSLACRRQWLAGSHPD